MSRLCSLAAFALVSILAGCAESYEPSLDAEHTSARYRADLQECTRTSNEQVRLVNASTFQSWIVSPFTGAGMVRSAVQDCMLRKGYREREGS